MSEREYLSFCMSNGIFLVSSCKFQSLKMGSLVASHKCNKFNSGVIYKGASSHLCQPAF